MHHFDNSKWNGLCQLHFSQVPKVLIAIYWSIADDFWSMSQLSRFIPSQTLSDAIKLFIFQLAYDFYSTFIRLFVQLERKQRSNRWTSSGFPETVIRPPGQNACRQTSHQRATLYLQRLSECILLMDLSNVARKKKK